MKYDLAPFEERVQQGYLRKSETDDLALYCYTDLCVYDEKWDQYTSMARGLILEKGTGEVIGKCFEKFFNLGERPETRLENLPAECGYECFEKMDGSAGIIFFYKGSWHVATKGSFFSDQAKMAQEMLKMYDFKQVDTDLTLLVEIIYPENKIVVDYGKDSKLTLLAAYDRETAEELTRPLVTALSRFLNMPLVPKYDLTINQMVKLQKSIPKDKEGFVVRFGNGLRVKIKGDEYLKIHRLLSGLSPLSLWETMLTGMVNRDYIMQIPEEYRPQYEPIAEDLEGQFKLIVNEINMDIAKLPAVDHNTRDGRKAIGLFVQSANLKHPSAMFPAVLAQREALEKYVMKRIRPTGNKMRTLE